ncbi:MAG: thioredoxin domain-containing protein [Candidatus Gracilibacteria bacterium]|nr:thioredoxin domain-containing protein [Candidatus Gracilibacteria bacterium]
MKKFFTFIISIFIISNLFLADYTFANNSINEEMFLNQSNLNKNIKGKKYIDSIDILIEKFEDKTKLKNLETKLKLLIDSNKIKNKYELNIITYLYKKTSNKINMLENNLVLTIITDKRDSSIDIEILLNELNKLPSIKNSKIEIVDFSDIGVKEYLIKNNIKTLPAFIFSTNKFDVSNDESSDTSGYPTPKINEFLTEIGNGEYFLNVGSTYNPFIIRSDKGFRIIEKETIDNIKNNSYIKGNSKAKITLLIYSDLECPYCAKLRNDGTIKGLEEKYGDDLNIIYNNFPLAFHSNAQTAAEILECLAEQKGSEGFYSLIDYSFEKKDSTKETLVNKAIELGADETKLNKCLEENIFTKKINDQMKIGTDSFSITGTPGNVIINNETLEYEVISGAYPISNFIEVIEKIK